jgi:hypothetical protein
VIYQHPESISPSETKSYLSAIEAPGYWTHHDEYRLGRDSTSTSKYVVLFCIISSIFGYPTIVSSKFHSLCNPIS